jgi:hypothetical protein
MAAANAVATVAVKAIVVAETAVIAVIVAVAIAIKTKLISDVSPQI